jgi:hypothetical protein
MQSANSVVGRLPMKRLLLTGVAALLMATSASAQSSGPGGYGSAFGGGLTGGYRGGYQATAPSPTPRQVACIRATLRDPYGVKRCLGQRVR